MDSIPILSLIAFAPIVGAVVIFLLGWLVLPIAVMLLGELHSPWFEIGCVALLAFIAVFIGAMVRVVRNF